MISFDNNIETTDMFINKKKAHICTKYNSSKNWEKIVHLELINLDYLVYEQVNKILSTQLPRQPNVNIIGTHNM